METQLTSYAALKHDNVLYVKESFTGSAGCEFPAVLVEPIPAFFQSIAAYAKLGLQAIVPLIKNDEIKGKTNRKSSLSWEERKNPTNFNWKDFFAHLQDVAERLETLAQKNVNSESPSESEVAWVNKMVTTKEIDQVCTVEIGKSFRFDINTKLTQKLILFCRKKKPSARRLVLRFVLVRKRCYGKRRNCYVNSHSGK